MEQNTSQDSSACPMNLQKKIIFKEDIFYKLDRKVVGGSYAMTK